MSLAEYAQLFAMAVQFQPDLIVELGRGAGNSTCVLTEAASRMDRARLVSFCKSSQWQMDTLARVASVTPAGWLDALEARVADILDVDFQKVTDEGRRVLLFWDAHGWQVAEAVLARVLPLLRDRPHLVVIHDILDIAHHPELKRYAGQGVWRGYPGDEAPRQYVVVDSMCSMFEEAIALADFANRNDVKVHSVEGEIRQEIESKPERAEEMRRLLGDQMYSPVSSFHWFTLNSLPADAQVSFPRFRPPAPAPEAPEPTSQEVLASQLANDFHRLTRRGSPSIGTFALVVAKVLMGRYRTDAARR
jgi:hypothetical protein